MLTCISTFIMKLVYRERIKRGDSPRGSSYNIKIMDEAQL